MVTALISWIVFGFLVGLVARAIYPGAQSYGFVETTLLGIAGSLLGGLLATLAAGASFDQPHWAGFGGSVLGALLALFLRGIGTGRSTV